MVAFEISPEVDLYRGKGCEKCTSTGYFGRSGVFELLVVDDNMRRLILRGADANELRKSAREQGMKTLFQDGSIKIRTGITTLSEVYRVTQEI
jgi:general secretion pathway protein E